MAAVIKSWLYQSAAWLIAVPFTIISVVLALVARQLSPAPKSPRLVWGMTPIISNKYWSAAMRQRGYASQTLMTGYYNAINSKQDFDEYVFDRYFALLPRAAKVVLMFWESLFRFDVFFISCEGWLLGKTPLRFLEAFILRVAGKKTIILPYGGDSYVYRNLASAPLAHGLMLSYPAAARTQDAIEKRVQYWARHGDAIIPGCATPDGFGRWSTLTPSIVHIDSDSWLPSTRHSLANGKNDTVYITHSPNHTGFKGTEFVVDAVEKLKAEGLKVELRLLQKLQNTEVKRILAEETDILVEQIIFTGYALSAIEGMACGLPVLSNLKDESYTLMQRRWSFLDECPIVSTSPENIIDNLRLLITNPALRAELGRASRQYVEKYHNLNAAAELYSSAIDYVYGRLDGQSFMNLYHPLLGKHKDTPRIQHPLKHSRIVS